MKKIIFLMFVFPVLLIGCMQPVQSPIAGAWEMVAGKWVSLDSTRIYEFPGNLEGNQICIYSDKYYLFSGRFKLDTAPDFSDNYGGGIYAYDGEKYEENLMFFPDPETIGKTLAFDLVINGDTLIKTGPIDVTEDMFWGTLREVYVRKD